MSTDYKFKVRISDVSASNLHSSTRHKEAAPLYSVNFDGNIVQSDVCFSPGDPSWPFYPNGSFEYILMSDTLETCMSLLSHKFATITVLFRNQEGCESSASSSSPCHRDVVHGSCRVDLLTLACGASRCVYYLYPPHYDSSNTIIEKSSGSNDSRKNVGQIDFTILMEQYTLTSVELQSVSFHKMPTIAPYELRYTLKSLEGKYEVTSSEVSLTDCPIWGRNSICDVAHITDTRDEAMHLSPQVSNGASLSLPRLSTHITLRELLEDTLIISVLIPAYNNKPQVINQELPFMREGRFELRLDEVLQRHTSHTVPFEGNAYAYPPGSAPGWGALVTGSMLVRGMPALAQLRPGASNHNGVVHGKIWLKSCIVSPAYLSKGKPPTISQQSSNLLLNRRSGVDNSNGVCHSAATSHITSHQSLHQTSHNHQHNTNSNVHLRSVLGDVYPSTYDSASIGETSPFTVHHCHRYSDPSSCERGGMNMGLPPVTMSNIINASSPLMSYSEILQENDILIRRAQRNKLHREKEQLPNLNPSKHSQEQQQFLQNSSKSHSPIDCPSSIAVHEVQHSHSIINTSTLSNRNVNANYLLDTSIPDPHFRIRSRSHGCVTSLSDTMTKNNDIVLLADKDPSYHDNFNNVKSTHDNIISSAGNSVKRQYETVLESISTKIGHIDSLVRQLDRDTELSITTDELNITQLEKELSNEMEKNQQRIIDIEARIRQSEEDTNESILVSKRKHDDLLAEIDDIQKVEDWLLEISSGMIRDMERDQNIKRETEAETANGQAITTSVDARITSYSHSPVPEISKSNSGKQHTHKHIMMRSSIGPTKNMESDDLYIEELLFTIDTGNVYQFRKLLTAQPDVIYKEDTILLRACSIPNPTYEIIAGIIALRPELVNIADTATGNTPLHFTNAARKVSADVAGCLVATGADIRAYNADGLTPFHVLLLNISDEETDIDIKDSHSIDVSVRRVPHHSTTVLKFLLRCYGKGLLKEMTSMGESCAHLCAVHDKFLPRMEFLASFGAPMTTVAVIPGGHNCGMRVTPLQKAKLYGGFTNHIQQYLKKHENR